MITREQVLEALRDSEEPTLRLKLVETGWIRDIVARDNRVSLTVVVHPDSLSAADELKTAIQAKLRNAGVGEPHIRVRAATESELAAAEQVRGGGPAGGSAGSGRGAAGTPAAKGSAGGAPSGRVPIGHAVGLQSPLLAPDSGVRFIAVASGKGGVGKSTVTVNLAVALARRGKRVGIIDADIYGFSVPDMMGIEETPTLEGDRIRPVERFGVRVMSMGFFVEDNSPVVWRGPMLGRMLRNFFADVEWGELDYMLLDLPPGTGDVALDVHQMIPQSKELIVTTPHATAAFVAARAGAMAIKTEHEILGVVENMAYYECPSCGEKAYVFGRGGGARLAEQLHVDLLAQFPLGAPDNHPSEPDFAPSVYKPDTPVGRMYLQLADAVIARCER